MVRAVEGGTDYRQQTRRGMPVPISRLLHNPGLLTRWRRPNGAMFDTEAGYVRFDSAQQGENALLEFCQGQVVGRECSFNGFFFRQRSRWDLEGGAQAMWSAIEAAKDVLQKYLGEFDHETPLVDFTEDFDGERSTRNAG